MGLGDGRRGGGGQIGGWTGTWQIGWVGMHVLYGVL